MGASTGILFSLMGGEKARPRVRSRRSRLSLTRLVEAIEAGLGRRYRQEWGREDRPLRARRRGQKDVVKKLQEDQADGIALGRQAVARQLFNKALGAQLG